MTDLDEPGSGVSETAAGDGGNRRQRSRGASALREAVSTPADLAATGGA